VTGVALKRKETSRVGQRRDTHSKGIAGGTVIEVKGQRATAAQRSAIDDALGEAHRLNASRRVMIALVMAGTQESSWTRAGRTGDDDVSYLQQGRNWISGANARKADLAARAFLLGHEADVGGTGQVQGWKQRHGSLKHAPGDLSTAIAQVQLPRRDLYGEYARWQKEAAGTVEAWLGADGTGFGGGSERTYVKRYEFTRGERHGARETSWDAMGRLAEEVAWRRWAATNVLFVASEDELRAGAVSVEIHGDEAWLLGRPQWDWGSGRAVTECTIRVLADRWGVLPGGVVMLSPPGPTRGRWLVKSVSGQSLDSPEIDVVLKRPTRRKPEPASETATTGGDGSSADSDGRITTRGGARGIVTQAAAIAQPFRTYVCSAYRAGSTTATGTSDHSANDEHRAARDIAVRGIDAITGPPSPRLDKAVVAIGEAFGRTYREGQVIDADTFTWRGYRIQIIWRTPKYGGHMGHIHVGARKA
jgi:hypothetical protein